MSAPPLTTIEISKDYLHFNSAHFTIFSATEREDLHGHTFYVRAYVTSPVDENGMAFDYNILKSRMMALCDHLDEKVLLPSLSPHLKLLEEDGYLVAHYADERLPFSASGRADTAGAEHHGGGAGPLVSGVTRSGCGSSRPEHLPTGSSGFLRARTVGIGHQ